MYYSNELYLSQYIYMVYIFYFALAFLLHCFTNLYFYFSLLWFFVKFLFFVIAFIQTFYHVLVLALKHEFDFKEEVCRDGIQVCNELTECV